jgi:ferredoxin
VAGSVDRPILIAYIIYYMVIALFVGLAVFAGRRAGCHTICWMAPFMIIGRWIRNRFGWASLRLVSGRLRLRGLQKMHLQLPDEPGRKRMVQLGKMENPECILCGTCVDNCSKNAIRYSFLYLTSRAKAWKVRHIRRNPNVSLTVPIHKQIPFLPWVKIPAATITFAGRACVHPPDRIGPELAKVLFRGLVLDEEMKTETSVIEIEPVGEFVTYGVCMPLMDMRDPTKARGRARVA